MDQIAFKVNQNDNVATALTDIGAGQTVIIRGDREIQKVLAKNEIPLGHKIAIHRIRAGGDITKSGLPIGRATKDIEIGLWVHVHNLASKIDIATDRSDND